MNIITLGAKPESVLPDGVAEATEKIMVASGAAHAAAVKYAKSRGMVAVYGAFDWMVPGQFEAFAYRKQFFEQQVKKGIANGATQVLNLGAGYDTLAWRLAPKFSERVNFFEVDHPATARYKARGIREMGQRPNLYLLAEDLSRISLAEVLSRYEPWDSKAQCVILAEGLVMYLPEKSVKDLFVTSASLSAHGSRIAFSYIPTGNDGRPDMGPFSGLMLWLQEVIGEPMLWSITPGEIGTYLKQTGWTALKGQYRTDHKYGVEFFASAIKLAVT